MNLVDVVDLDCIVSLSPLLLDLTSRFRRGVAAIQQRVLVCWIERGAGRLEGEKLAPVDLRMLEQRLSRATEALDFVASASVRASVVGDMLTVRGLVRLVEVGEFALEVVASKAAPIVRLGAL